MSRYYVVAARSVVFTHEIETMLDDVDGPSTRPINTTDYLDWGGARALGIRGGFRFRNRDGDDTTMEVRADWDGGPEAFDIFFQNVELELRRQQITGPAPEDEERLRGYRWDPTGMFRVIALRAQQEIDQVSRFDEDPRWRRGRVRDVVASREILIEINEVLFEGTSARGVVLDDIFDSRQRTRELLDAMPSFDVAVTLRTEYHRDPNHRWTQNDIHDIDALGSTIPYCDVVVTDQAAATDVKRTRLAE